MKENSIYKVYYITDDAIDYGIKEVYANSWIAARQKFSAECPELDYVMMEHNHLFKH